VALLIIIAAKFAEGAWIVLIAIPCVIYLLKRIHRYYSTLEARLQDQGQLDLQHNQPPIALVAIEGWNRLADHALLFATRITSDVIALHFTELEGPDVDEHSRRLRERWTYKVEAPARAAGRRPPQLVLTRAPYRRMAEPLLQFIADLERKEPAREIAVLLPEVVKKHWWQYILHGYRVRRLHAALLSHGGSRVVVVEVPWYLEEPRPAGRM